MLHLSSVDGTRLAVHDLGPDRLGAPVVYAHATGFHGRVWEPFARHLTGTSGWAPDLRGHGDSPVPPGSDFDWERFADDVLAVTGALQLDRPAGIGHSKGGAALLLAEARAPGTFSSLWLYEPVVFPPTVADSTVGPKLAEGARARRERFDSLEAAEANFAAKRPFDALDPEALHAYVEGGFAIDSDGSAVLKCRPEDEAAVYMMGGRHEAWQRASAVRCPVTVVRGSTAFPGPAVASEALAERLPAGTLEVHDELGHFGPLEATRAMAESAAAAFAR